MTHSLVLFQPSNINRKNRKTMSELVLLALFHRSFNNVWNKYSYFPNEIWLPSSLKNRLRWGMVAWFQKVDFHCFVEWFNWLFYNVLNISAIQCVHFKRQFQCMVFLCDFMKNFHFDTTCCISQKPQEQRIFNCGYGFIGKSAVIKYYQLLSKVIINGKWHFDQLAAAPTSIPP